MPAPPRRCTTVLHLRRGGRATVDSDGRRGAAPGRPAQKGRPEGSAGCLPPYPDTGEGMPRGESGSAISVALEQLRNQTTDVEFQRAVSFLLAKATELRGARHDVFDSSLFRCVSVTLLPPPHSFPHTPLM